MIHILCCDLGTSVRFPGKIASIAGYYFQHVSLKNWQSNPGFLHTLNNSQVWQVTLK